MALKAPRRKKYGVGNSKFSSKEFRTSTQLISIECVCGRLVENCSHDTDSVICSRCFMIECMRLEHKDKEEAENKKKEKLEQKINNKIKPINNIVVKKGRGRPKKVINTNKETVKKSGKRGRPKGSLNKLKKENPNVKINIHRKTKQK